MAPLGSVQPMGAGGGGGGGEGGGGGWGGLAEHVGELEGICRAAETSRKLFLLDKVM